MTSYLAVVAEELRTTTDDASIRTSLQMLTPEMWPRLAEVARLRIENKLLSGLEEGKILEGGKTTQALATWSSGFLKAFSLRKRAARTLVSKLEDSDRDDRHYVAKYFMSHLPDVVEPEGWTDRCIRAIASAIKEDDENVRFALISSVRSYPAEWQTKLATALSEQTDPENPAVVLDDGTPLLSSPEITDDDIPF